MVIWITVLLLCHFYGNHHKIGGSKSHVYFLWDLGSGGGLRGSYARVPGQGVLQYQFSSEACVCLSHSVLSDSLWPKDCSPPGSSVHGILQARVLEWVAMPSSRGSSQSRAQTQASHTTGGFFTIWTAREAQSLDWGEGHFQTPSAPRQGSLPCSNETVPCSLKVLYLPTGHPFITETDKVHFLSYWDSGSLWGLQARRGDSQWAPWERIFLPVQETQVQSLGWEDPLEEGMATHSRTLAWRIPWTEGPGELQCVGSQRVGHDWGTSVLHAHMQAKEGDCPSQGLFLMIEATSPGHAFHMQTDKSQACTPANSFIWLSHTRQHIACLKPAQGQVPGP